MNKNTILFILFILSWMLLDGCDTKTVSQANSSPTPATMQNQVQSTTTSGMPLRKIIFVTPNAYTGDLVTAVNQLSVASSGLQNICTNLTGNINLNLSPESGFLAADCLCSATFQQSITTKKLQTIFALPKNYTNQNYVYRAVLQGRPTAYPATIESVAYYPVESIPPGQCRSAACYPNLGNTPITIATGSDLLGFSAMRLTTAIHAESLLMAWTGITPTNTYMGNVVFESPSIQNFWYNMNLTIPCYVGLIMTGTPGAISQSLVTTAVNQVMFACASFTPGSNFQAAAPWSSALSLNKSSPATIQTFGIYGATFSRHGSNVNNGDPQINWSFVTPTVNGGGCAVPRHLLCAGPYPPTESVTGY